MQCAAKVVLQAPITDLSILSAFVEACLRDGVELIAVAGVGRARVEDLIDELIIGDGADETRFIVTTSHEGETLEEALEFATNWPCEGDDRVDLVHF